MRFIQKLYFLSALLLLVFLSFCSKKTGTDSVTPNPLIFGRVLEAGTDRPLAGAEFITSTCVRSDNVFGCVQWNEVSTFTGTDGKFSVGRTQFRNHLLRKNGYWTYINEPDASVRGGYVNYQPAPVNHFINSSTGQTDSILVKLLPVTIITIRARNTGPFTGAVLQCRALLFGTRGNNISLRPGIDSSFSYPVFGNADNKIFVYRGFPFSDTAGMQIRYIANGEALNLDITY